jgi:hypothetical protein
MAYLGAVCHRCATDIATVERVGRLDTCLKCGAYLHCCLNCRFYDPGSHNDCRETQAERQVDKEAGNFCEYFVLRHGDPKVERTETQADSRARLEALFRKGAG